MTADRPLLDHRRRQPEQAVQAPRRALIVGTGRDRGALAAARALERAGWHVGVGTPDGPGMLGATRAASVRHEVPRPRGDGAGFIDGVRRAVAEGDYDVVFGAGDDWMAAVSAYRQHIPAAVAHPGPDVVAEALDKVGLTDRAASREVTGVTERAIAQASRPRTTLSTPCAKSHASS